jgi:glucokinase
MSLMITEVYDALRSANVPEDAAKKAAAAVATYEPQLADIRSDLRLLKWMVGTNAALSVVVLGALGGIYALLFNIASRLPR